MANQVYISGQANHDLATPRFDFAESSIDFSHLTKDELKEIYQTAEDLSCTADEAYLELKSIGVI